MADPAYSQFILEHGYCKSNRIERWWPLSSSRPSDAPDGGTARKRRRRLTWELAKDQPGINSACSRFSDNDASLENIKRSLFRDDLCLTTCSRDSHATVSLASAVPPDNPVEEMETSDGPATSDASNRESYSSSYKVSDMLPSRMPSSSIHMFNAIVAEGCWEKAIDFISLCPFQVPPVPLVQTVLHKILLQSEDKRIATKAFIYLNGLLDLYPPSNITSQEYYYKIMFENELVGFKMWDIMGDIISCCLRKCGYEKPQCDRNCILLLKFFVAVLQKEHTELLESRHQTPVKLRSYPSLVQKMFWPNRAPGSSSNPCRDLIEQINRMYLHDIGDLELQLLYALMSFICLAAESARHHIGCSRQEAIGALHCSFFAEIQQDICRCNNITESRKNLELFLNSISLTWLRIAVCESLLNEVLGGMWQSGVRTTPLLLRKIVFCYMFPEHPSTAESKEKNAESESCQPVPKAKSKTPVKNFKRSTQKSKALTLKLKRGCRGKTPLHKACADELPGTLVGLLCDPKTSADINKPDNMGWTALHEACYAESFMCVKLLLQGSHVKDYGHVPNLCALDHTSVTPLHIAVMKDMTDIADLLLETGGYELVFIENDDGIAPIDLAESADMKAVLQKHVQEHLNQVPSGATVELPTAETAHDKKDSGIHFKEAQLLTVERLLELGSPPKLEDPTKCATYLLCLHFLLQNFLNFYGLLELFRNLSHSNIDIFTSVKCHLTGKLELNSSVNDVVNRYDDVFVMKSFSTIVERFYEKFLQEYCVKGKQNADVTDLLLCFRLLACMV